MIDREEAALRTVEIEYFHPRSPALGESVSELLVKAARQRAHSFDNVSGYVVIVDFYAELLLKSGDDVHDYHRIELWDAAKKRRCFIECVGSTAELQGFPQDLLYAVNYTQIALRFTACGGLALAGCPS